MNPFIDRGTIVGHAGSTQETVAISIIRISGKLDFNFLAPFFSISLKNLSPRKQTLSSFLFQGKAIDEILVSFFPGPQSFTGEDMLELSVHGNPLNVERIVNLLVQGKDFRRARPGEFTLRAYRNKKLRPHQVEGLLEFFQARGQPLLDLSMSTIHGELHCAYLDLQASLVGLKSALEINIDFAQDLGPQRAEELLQERLKNFLEKMTSLALRAEIRPELFKNPSIVLLGPTNAGKSTLFNCLLGDHRSIVSKEEGTTRDYISENLKARGVFFRLIDTAGFRSQDVGSIEREGIHRMRELSERAFFRIFVAHVGHLDSFGPDEKEEIKRSHLLILSHKDQWGGGAFWETSPCPYQGEALFLDIRENSPQKIKWFPSFSLGPREGSGGLREFVLKRASDRYQSLIEKRPICSDRQRELLLSLHEKSASLKEAVFSGDLGVVSHELELMGFELEELLGAHPLDEVFENIFSQFCIGK